MITKSFSLIQNTFGINTFDIYSNISKKWQDNIVSNLLKVFAFEVYEQYVPTILTNKACLFFNLFRLLPPPPPPYIVCVKVDLMFSSMSVCPSHCIMEQVARTSIGKGANWSSTEKLYCYLCNRFLQFLCFMTRETKRGSTKGRWKRNFIWNARINLG